MAYVRVACGQMACDRHLCYVEVRPLSENVKIKNAFFLLITCLNHYAAMAYTSPRHLNTCSNKWSFEPDYAANRQVRVNSNVCKKPQRVSRRAVKWRSDKKEYLAVINGILSITCETHGLPIPRFAVSLSQDLLPFSHRIETLQRVLTHRIHRTPLSSFYHGDNYLTYSEHCRDLPWTGG